MTKTRKLKRKTVKPRISEGERKRRTLAYQRAYYLAHQEKAKEYQRQYNLEHKKAQGLTRTHAKIDRPKVASYKLLDIQNLPPEKIVKNWARIVR